MNKNSRLNIGRIMALQKVRSKLVELSCTMEELGRPMLEDLSLLDAMHGIYLDFFRRRGMVSHAGKVYNRQKFILVALFLFSPRTLAGGKMRIGLRDRISKLFGLSAKTTISDNCGAAVGNYLYYRDFKKDVDEIYSAVAAELGDRFVYED